jgi:hypothetical protein
MKIFRKLKARDVAYTFSAPNGVPGDITRPDMSNIEPAMLVPVGSSPPVYAQSFGIPVKYAVGSGVPNGVQQFNGGAETAPSFAGVLIREVPQQAAIGDLGTFSGSSPNPLQPQGLCVRGYCSVLCYVGTPARGGTVYVQIVADNSGPGGSAVPVGAFRADGTDGGNAIALTATQAEWASDGVDAFGNAELRIAR